jgi:hypothetical protein
MTTLAPVRKTRMLQRRTRTGLTRPECWEAVTVGPDGEPDGLWTFRRLDMHGTPWEPEYGPTGETGPWSGSLPDCQRGSADGSLLEWIETNRRKTA